MTIRAVKKVSSSLNGMGAFILPCNKMEFTFCNRGGSSKGMIAFLKNHLQKFASENPEIEVLVKERKFKHPVIRSFYNDNREKQVCVKNYEANEIWQRAINLRNRSGRPLTKERTVISRNVSTRGIWSVLHAEQPTI